MLTKTNFTDDLTSFIKFDYKTLGPKLILPFLTLLGSWGGFPEAPKSFQKLADNNFFKYFFLWVLVMQGGASADPDLSLVAVIIFGIISESIKYFEKEGEDEGEDEGEGEDEDEDDGEDEGEDEGFYYYN